VKATDFREQQKTIGGTQRLFIARTRSCHQHNSTDDQRLLITRSLVCDGISSHDRISPVFIASVSRWLRRSS